VGCQGFSTGGSGQQQNGTLSFISVSVDFGSVNAGTSKLQTITATNSGTVPITITSASVSTKYFSVTGPSLPVTIDPGQQGALSLQFAPNAAGSFAATVTINSDATNPVTTIGLSGTGSGSGQLALTPNSEPFGSVLVGTKSSSTVTLTNNSPATVNISQIDVTGTGFSFSGITAPLSLTPSQGASFTVSFSPLNNGIATGAVTITSDAPNPSLTLALSGTGVLPGALASNPTSLDFGNVTIGSKLALSETLTNTGDTSVTISSVGITGTGFSLTGANPVTLVAGQSTTFTVTFKPQSASSASGTVTVVSNATNPNLDISLSGSGTSAVGQLTVAPNTLNVGSVAVGNSGSASGTLTASGANVTVTAANANNSAFSVSGLPLPANIQAGHSASFSVTFSPLVTGSVSALLTFTSNAQQTTTTETLTGTGTTPHRVSLSWNASTSSDVTGYNIYRSPFITSCGAYAKINLVIETSTAFTDTSVVSGSSYCYASTAVDSNNQESAYSNIVSNIKIPTP
jgi:hypothetical protein